ncbi:MAG: hypothetical protein COB65_14320 [Thalassobium sp.]|nr:MAG: hypothetical protein COB65_14320 [Thalassobium sp.]
MVIKRILTAAAKTPRAPAIKAQAGSDQRIKQLEEELRVMREVTFQSPQNGHYVFYRHGCIAAAVVSTGIATNSLLVACFKSFWIKHLSFCPFAQIEED